MEKTLDYQSLFKMPNSVKITGRSSSITNAFVNGIVPCIHPTAEEIKQVLQILGMHDSIRCSYCGGNYSEWDHFRPLVQNRRPTGYITEINNLVPSCGKCNQSKGNSYWKDWILSDARLSPKTRNVDHLGIIITRLEKYEIWSRPVKVNFEELVGENVWNEHWENWKRLLKMMKKSQILSDQIKATIEERIDVGAGVKPMESAMRRKEIALAPSFTNRKIAEIVRGELKNILVRNQVPMEKIVVMQTLKYSKQQFNLNFPLLKEVDESKDLYMQRLDHKERSRYYKDPLTIHGKRYFLTSQWYEYNRKFLLNWLEKYSL